MVLEQQERITTQRFISVWEKAAATAFPPLTSRIFEISSDPFGFNAKICPWKIIPITLSQNLLCDVPISLVIFGFNIMRDDVEKVRFLLDLKLQAVFRCQGRASLLRQVDLFAMFWSRLSELLRFADSAPHFPGKHRFLSLSKDVKR